MIPQSELQNRSKLRDCQFLDYKIPVRVRFISQWVAVMIGACGCVLGQNALNPPGSVREWTSTEGKVITAEYLGVKGTDAMLKLAGGRVVGVPLVKLSVTDNAYVRENLRPYLPPWTGWPSEASSPIASIAVSETKSETGDFVYETSHFRFHVDGNLGAPLMKELARVFELTYSLQANAPFGLLAKPEKDRFEAKLFGTTSTYHSEGGPKDSAGVYLPKKKVFLAPLDLMGVRSDGNVWRRMSGGDYDTTTVVHELTHMFTHELLDKLPIWMNEGYAEFISNIPIEGNSFRVGADKIREGLLNSLVPRQGTANNGVARISRITTADRKKFLESGKLPDFCKVSDVLSITDAKWATSSNSSISAPGVYDYSTREALYRTSHLILYYFIQIEGAKGVEKLRAFLEENRAKLAVIDAYEVARADYERKMDEFFKLPGVTRLEDGKFRYPSSLKPPVAPVAPDVDPEKIRLSGLVMLLDGMTVEDMGQKIESALVQDLGIKINFGRKITSNPFGKRVY